MDVPKWIAEMVKRWQVHLVLHRFRIKVRMNRDPADDCRALASCTQYPLTNEVRLDFRPDIEDDQRGRESVIHEMLHAFHSDVDYAVEHVIIPQLPNEVAREMAVAMYRAVMEAATESMAVNLYDLVEREFVEKASKKTKAKK